MKTFALAILSSVLASSAFAQEITTDNIDPEIPTFASNPHTLGLDTFSWQGAYIGVNGGYSWGKFHNEINASDVNSGETSDISASISRSGFLGGVQAGYNWQYERNVYGLELDLQGGSMKKEKALFDDTVNSFKQKNSIDWYSSARGRLGYAVSPTAILYTTGGLAYGKVSTGISVSDGANTETDSWKKNTFGYTFGGGTEIAMTDNLTFKTEYLYTDLGNTKTLNFANENFGTNLRGETRFDFHTVRAGFNLKF